MAGELKNGMQCGEFDALLTEALDGTLSGTRLVRFDAHRTSCQSCSAMFQETQAGLNWLKALPEVDPPAGFMQRVLIATSGEQQREAKAEAAAQSWRERLLGYLVPAMRQVGQPRFAMSFGMAFFSITLVLNIAGVKLSSLKQVDLRPRSIVRSYYETSGRLVKYYENIRFVYELETRVRELKRVATPADDKQEQKKEKQQKKGEEPEQRNYQNYSQDDTHAVLADCTECGSMETWFPTQRRQS
jgi:hypothetical protein